MRKLREIPIWLAETEPAEMGFDGEGNLLDIGCIK